MTVKLQSKGSDEEGICGEMDLLEPHIRGEPVGQNIATNDKELAGTFLVGYLPNHKEGAQDRNEALFVDGE